MSTKIFKAMVCDRCFAEDLEAIPDQWPGLAVGGSISLGVHSGVNMCPSCTQLFTDWWNRRAEFPVVKTEVIGRMRAALDMEDIKLIREQIGMLVNGNVASAFQLASLKPDLFLEGAPELPVAAIKEEVAALVAEIVARHGLTEDGQ